MKKILMVGCGEIGRLAMMELKMPGVEIVHVTPSQALEAGYILTDPDPTLKPMILTNPRPIELFKEPQNRKERRKQARAKRRKRK